MIPDGIKLEEMEKFAKLLEKEGALAIHVSAGTVCSSPPWFFQHMFISKGKNLGNGKGIIEIVFGFSNGFAGIQQTH